MSDNVERLKKFQAVAKQDEITEEEMEKAELKKLDYILEKTDKTRYVYVRSLNCKLPYKPILISALTKVSDKKTDSEIAVEMLYQIFHAADKSVTYEKIKRIPLDIANEIIFQVTNQNFLQ